MEFLGFTVETLGTILIAFTALRVHHRVLHEHQIDEGVFRSMKFEQRIGVLGVILVIIGYLMQSIRFF